jgi:hypothetical protein
MLRVLSALFGALLFVMGACALWAGGELLLAMRDPALGGPQPAAATWRWHRALTPAYERWARRRLASDEATRLPLEDVAGTEWPLFGSVYYLRATENLDRAWQQSRVGPRPADYARGAIDAAAALVADPSQAHWVMRHWGAADYLHRENVFYRMLLIDAIATQWRLLHATPHAALLHEQVDAFAEELAASSKGLLADYPQQTFPADVAAAWHAILRADDVLGTDHREAAAHALRGFVGTMAPDGELPPYAWFGDPETATSVRGSANAWLLHHAPFLWPEQARTWFAAGNRRFWHASPWMSGYREYDQADPYATGMDVDSGPIVAGLGASASAFGIGAARSVGDTARARILALEGIAVSLPLPNGRLLLPRLASDAVDAPLLGEAAMLYNLTQPPAPGFETLSPESAPIPAFAWIVLALLLLLGTLLLSRGVTRIARSVPFALRRKVPRKGS